MKHISRRSLRLWGRRRSCRSALPLSGRLTLKGLMHTWLARQKYGHTCKRTWDPAASNIETLHVPAGPVNGQGSFSWVAPDILQCSFEAHFPPDTVKLGTSERQIVLLGGKAFIEDGPLAQFIGMHQDFPAPEIFLLRPELSTSPKQQHLLQHVSKASGHSP